MGKGNAGEKEGSSKESELHCGVLWKENRFNAERREEGRNVIEAFCRTSLELMLDL